MHIQSYDLNTQDRWTYKKVNGEMYLVHRTTGVIRIIPNL
ncbi:DUF6906 family protein [Bacillus cereus]